MDAFVNQDFIVCLKVKIVLNYQNVQVRIKINFKCLLLFLFNLFTLTENVCDTTETFGCGVKHCELICGEEFNESCMVADFLCKNDCFCKDGFIRAKNGMCIPDVECKNLKTFKSQ